MADVKRTRKSSIARLLKKETDIETQKVSKAIDKALEKNLTSVGSFSVVGIRRACKKMLDSLDDFDRKDFFGSFFDLYNLCMAPDLRAKGVFHPSSLKNACPRSLVYDLQCAPRDPFILPVSGALQRTFDVGSWYHLYIQNILLNIGLLEQAEVPVINKERFINGKADGVFKYEVFGEKVVLEIKTMNDMVYQKAIFKPFEKHEFQASLYARELGATKVLYLYINKNTSEIKEFLRPLNSDTLSQADKIMSSAISHVGAGTLPKRVCPDNVCEEACACPYRTHCFKE